MKLQSIIIGLLVFMVVSTGLLFVYADFSEEYGNKLNDTVFKRMNFSSQIKIIEGNASNISDRLEKVEIDKINALSNALYSSLRAIKLVFSIFKTIPTLILSLTYDLEIEPFFIDALLGGIIITISFLIIYAYWNRQ